MNDAGTLLLILLGIVGIVLLCLEIPVLQIIIAVGCGIYAFFLLLATVLKIYRSMKLKEYFWQVFPECDKDYLNYGFILRNRKFQKERSEKLLQCDQVKGLELIKLENSINNSLYAILVLMMVAVLFLKY